MGKGNTKGGLCNGSITKCQKRAQGSLTKLYKTHKERIYGREGKYTKYS